MIKCKKCKRQTQKKEPTGLRLVVEDLEKGKRIMSSSIVCMKCIGEKYGK